jgi:hypothetical protein
LSGYLLCGSRVGSETGVSLGGIIAQRVTGQGQL